ncbi:MAG: glycerate kinase type-2 family protein [Spirochaetota bacterium]
MEDRYYQHIEKIYTAAIESVNPYTAVHRVLNVNGNRLDLKTGSGTVSHDLDAYRNIFVVGAGKATAPMAQALEEIFNGRITDGLISVKYGHTLPLKHIRIVEAAHPTPDQNGLAAADSIAKLLEEAGDDDLVISLISGGGSALLPLPAHSLSLDDLRITTGTLLSSGASIHEINAVRKHISRSKGGTLAQSAAPATVISLLISDVVGDNPDVIASGPFVPDTTTYADALAVIEKRGISSRIPASVMEHLTSGSNGHLPETPKKGDACFIKVTNEIIVSNFTALQHAADTAKALGYNTLILSSVMEGDTAQSAMFHTAIAREIVSSENPVARPACILSGGETTVTVTGGGKGGRNTEFALQSALFLEGFSGIYCASIATDGTDGPTDAAGAIVDCQTVRRALAKGLSADSFLSDNDSYTFFDRTGALVRTGPTQTNVMDIHIFLAV